LHVARLVRIVPQHRPDLLDAGVDAELEIDEGLLSPDLLLDILPPHDFTGMSNEKRQDPGRLRMEF
jgi:hypothetical protein